MTDADGFERLDLGRPARPDPDPARPDADALAPFVVDAPPDPGQPGSAAPPTFSRWWLLVAAALALGVVVGVVVDDAREGLTADAELRLIVGPIEASPVSQEDGPRDLAINLFNSGPEPVDIAAVTVHGWLMNDDEQPAETVESGTWVRITFSAEPDCESRPSGRLTVDAETRGGDRSVELTTPPGTGALVAVWTFACEETYTEVGVVTSEVQVRAADSLIMTATFVQSTVPVLNVVSVHSGTPGFALETPVLPIPLRAGVPGELTLTWSVDACTDALELVGAAINANVETADGGTETHVSMLVDNRMLVELARLAERACET